MSRSNTAKDLSLKSMELFQICAEKGSLQAVAQETGLTVSTVSHHLRNLETHLGVELFNHSRRPMVLTPKGRNFLRNIEGALLTIRKAKAEASSGDPIDASHLRIGTIEDFESDIIPELAVFLSSCMPACDFLYHTDSSYDVIEMLRNRQLELGITATTGDKLGDLQERPLVNDPFVVVLPKGCPHALVDVVTNRTPLPFLRFSSNLLIGRLIEAQLRRLGVSTTRNFECSNNQTLMAMVAANAGWTITTPLMFSRANRFQADLDMHRFPDKSFARTLTVVNTPDCSQSVVDLVNDKLRSLIWHQIIAPSHQATPWLAESFKLIG